MSKRKPKIDVITGARAEFGLLLPVIQKLFSDTELETEVVVTGSHLCRDLGYTIDEIEAAGVPTVRTIDILGDDPKMPVDAAMSRALSGFSQYFKSAAPDMIVVLGDRYEIFAAVTAAAINDIPVAHISGGETTEGAKDEFFRHCITKMSCLHFAATERYRKRIIQLGERPGAVFNAGSLGAENIRDIVFMTEDELSDDIGFDVTRPFILCTYHPETLGDVAPLEGLDNLLTAIEELEARCLFTAANADEGGSDINAAIEAFCKRYERAKSVKSLGARRYLSAMRYCVAVAGNSSSAIVEAPTLHKPAVNIGDRQKGRIMGGNTICCGTGRSEILAALKQAMSPEFAHKAAGLKSPYGDGGASDVIVREIKRAMKDGVSLKKSFYDIDFEVAE